MEPTKRCPYCGELILRIAIRCKHCQVDLRGERDDSAPEPAHPAASAPTAPFPTPPNLQNLRPVTGPVPLLPPEALGHGDDDFAAFAAAGFGPPAHSHQPGAGPNEPQAPPPDAGHAKVDHAAEHTMPLSYMPPAEGSFEHRFLDFAFKTTLPISAATVAYALKIPIDEADEGLQDLAARDVLIREVDARGVVTYVLPGRTAVFAATSGHAATNGASREAALQTALSPYSQPPQLLYDPPGALAAMPTESTALAGLLVNVCFPGLGSLIGGKTSSGVFQLLMFLLGLPLSVVVIGIPMVMGAWIWGLVTGVNMLNEAKQQSSQRRLAG